jgi:preprotein translocase subunit SecD
VLWLVAIGTVRGFAFFLGLSTLINIVITFFFTRPLVIILGRNPIVTEARMIGLSRGLGISDRVAPS